MAAHDATSGSATEPDLPAELSTHSITMLIEKLRSQHKPDADLAAARLWERYMSDLLRLARNLLSVRIRRREDEHDVLQSMFKSFCMRHQRGDYELGSRDDLWRLLVRMTGNKARSAAKRHTRQRRDVRQEHVDSDGGPEPMPRALDLAADQKPTPEDAAMLVEECAKRLGMLPPDERRVAEMSLAGLTNKQVAAELGCVERTVERKLNLIRCAWSQGEHDNA
jgi:RNA polymerase sigma factor (sigma-70 family)